MVSVGKLYAMSECPMAAVDWMGSLGINSVAGVVVYRALIADKINEEESKFKELVRKVAGIATCGLGVYLNYRFFDAATSRFLYCSFFGREPPPTMKKLNRRVRNESLLNLGFYSTIIAIFVLARKK